MSPESLRRVGVFGSMALYGVACAIPAMGIRPNRDPSSVQLGYECLYLGLVLGVFITPFLAWLMNPFVWFLWVQGLRATPTNRNIWWLAGCLAVLAVLIMFYTAIPLTGAYLWVASIALAGLSCTPKELAPGQKDLLRHFRKPR
jgi:hypothetical protein